VSISNSATDGDPVLSFELSGTAQFTMGVDDGDSDKFKIGTTAIGTDTILELTGGNPHVKVTSADATTNLWIDNTAADGDSVLVFALSGSEKFSMGVDDGDGDIFKIGTSVIGTSTNLEMNGTAVFFPDGSTANPSVSFISDADSGFYWNAADKFSASVGGATLMEWSVGGVTMVSQNFFFQNGSAAAPSITFNSDPNLGIYRDGADSLGISTAGAERVVISDGGLKISSSDLFVRDGTAGGPSIRFTDDTDTGLFRTGADVISITCGGVEALRVEDSADLGAAETSLFVYDNDGATLSQVTVGADDSGGAGYKVLRIPN
jgi:hypothetical protein